MAPDEALQLIIEGMNYAAYHETDFSLYDSDKNRLFGSEHYNSGRPVYEPSPWAEGDFEEKMAMLLVWANVLNRSVSAFVEAERLLENEDSILGRVIRSAKNWTTTKTTDEILGTRFVRARPRPSHEIGFSIMWNAVSEIPVSQALAERVDLRA